MITEEVPLCEGSIYTKTFGYVECKVSNNRIKNEFKIKIMKIIKSTR